MGAAQAHFKVIYGCRVLVGFAAFAFRLQRVFLRPEAKAFAPFRRARLSPFAPHTGDVAEWVLGVEI